MSKFEESVLSSSDDEMQDHLSKSFSKSLTLKETETEEDSDVGCVNLDVNRLRQRQLDIIETDSSENEREDVRAFSPTTRLSITGIKSHLSSDESDESSDIEYDHFKDTMHGYMSSAKKKETDSTFFVQQSSIKQDSTASGNKKLKNKDLEVYQRNDEDPVLTTSKDIIQKSFQKSEINESLVDIVETASVSTDLAITESYEMPVLSPSPSDYIEREHKTDSTVISKQSLMKYVSQEYFQKEAKHLEDLKSKKTYFEKLYKRTAKNLPDEGKRLDRQIKNLGEDIAIRSKCLASMVVEDKPLASPLSLTLQGQRKDNFNTVPGCNVLSNDVNSKKPYDATTQGIATIENQKALTVDNLKALHNALGNCPTADTLADDPKGLTVPLMRHQRQALAWMCWREHEKPKGGILADDMGLGKTLTMIALVLACELNERSQSEDDDNENDEDNNCKWSSKGRRDYYPGGTLIICPASLLSQWEFERKNKISGAKPATCVHHGKKRESTSKLLCTYDIVITTYTIVTNEHKVRGALFGIKWKRIVLDEGHIVRNHKSRTSVAVCALYGIYRWVLTGTPIHNKQMDVYALLKFLHYSPFDQLTYWKRCIEKGASGQKRLNTILNTVLLRRTKAQLQALGELSNLPQKRTDLIEIELDKDEMNVYQRVMAYSRHLFAQFLMQRAERDPDFLYSERGSSLKDAYHKIHKKLKKTHRDGVEIKSHEILVLLLRLRQICCHPGLIVSMLQSDEVQQMSSESEATQTEFDLLEQLNKMATDDNNETVRDIFGNRAGGDCDTLPTSKASMGVLKKSNPVFDFKRPSSKMRKVLEILRMNVLKTNDKAIVVSQWTSVLEILGSHLEEAGISTLAFTGRIPVKDRPDIISEFNDPSSKKRILLLSLTAGGVGLNLIGANNLLLFDCHWNPQLEAQAQDRVYRVGQKKNVIIHKFICKDTVEERIQALQERKLALADNVLSGGKASKGSKLTMDELQNLFGM